MLLKDYSRYLLLFFVAISLNVNAQDYYATQVSNVPIIDGVDDDAAWDDAEWNDIEVSWWVEAGWKLKDNDWSGGDYAGKFKCVWKDDIIYILAEIEDDILNDDITDPFEKFWDEDLLEVFIDEDNTGGSHKEESNAFNAFAYHLAINSIHAIDNNYVNGDKLDLASFIEFKMKEKSTNIYTWEVAIPTYTDAFSPTASNNPTTQLSVGQIVGLSVAYCEDDGNGRENFFGSNAGAGNTCSTNADKYGDLKLEGPKNANALVSTSQQNFTIYPNPSEGQFNIKLLNGDINNTSISVYDISGKTVYSSRLYTADNHINLNGLESGIYVLELTIANERFKERIIIK